jgi:biopolymer transport protein ExbD
MVDLAFLLITFFMLTTSLSKPQSMDLGLPDKEKDPLKKDIDIKVDQRRTMTVIMGDNDKIKWYHGLLDSPEPNGKPTDAQYGKNGLRKEILKRVVSIPQVTGDKEKGLIVIIKPSKKSTYRNLVDVLDEMAICKVPTYAIVNDITPEEKALIEEMNK